MMDGLRPYSDMKATGLPWLGAVPTHWDVRRAKRILKPTEIPVRPVDDIVTCFRDGQVTLRKNRRSSGFTIALLEQGYQGVRIGQLVVHSMDAFAGAIGISDSDGKCTPEYIVCDPREPGALLVYYAWLLRYVAQTKYILAAYPAVRERAPRLRYPDLGELKLPAPPLDEQRLIARLLDWHGAQTAKLIRAKKRIIALLNEQKQAIIHRAVTRGLDPDVRLKPSGIPWLGDVPEAWEVKPVLACYKEKNTKNTGMAETTVLSLSYGRIVIKAPEKLRGLVPESFETYQVVDPGNIIVRSTDLQNDKKSLRVGIARDRGIITSAYMCLKTIGSMEPEFGYQILNTYDLLKIIYGYGSGLRQNLGFADIRRMPVPLPPPKEQLEIVNFLKQATEEVSAVIERMGNEIALLQEFRTRLIAEVVTGKLDVRAVAASLPEVTELEPIDDLVEIEDLDEAADDAENEEVAA